MTRQEERLFGPGNVCVSTPVHEALGHERVIGLIVQHRERYRQTKEFELTHYVQVRHRIYRVLAWTADGTDSTGPTVYFFLTGSATLPSADGGFQARN